MEKVLFDYISRYITLTAEEKQVILELGIFKSYKKDTVILKEGQRSVESYFVMKGCIRCYYMINGQEKTTAFYTESEVFAPICTITKQPSEHYVDCTEDVILLTSTPDIEQFAFEKFPRFETLCRIVSEERASENQVSFDNFKTSSPEERYLDLLKNRPDLMQRVPQYQLASFLGITPQSLSRLRKRIVSR